jgi:hypothetical protein
MTDDIRHWGLAGLGRHGEIAIDLDEPIDHDWPWHLQISGRGWEFVFDVAGPEVARSFLAFMRDHFGRDGFAELRLASFEAANVVIVKDSEFSDRYWLRIRATRGIAEVTIAGDNAISLLNALEDLVSDLAE